MSNETELLEAPETTEAPEPAPSLRESLEEAFEKDSGEEKSESTESASPPPSAEAPATVPTPEQPAPVEPAGDPKAAPAPTELKPPSQWKPEVREHWNKLPRAVQEEIHRREADGMRLIGSVGPKIRIADEVSGHIAPFAERLSQNGVSPSAFLGDVFSTVKNLAAGTPEQKAEVVANIVQSYGVDLRTLDAVLTRRISTPPEVLQARHQVARANMVLQQNAKQGEQLVQQQADGVVQQFAADPKHEFLDDVRHLMADLVESGRVNNLEDAYSAAVWAYPETRKILLQREAQQRATAKNSRAVAARRASSSVSGTPSMPGGANPANGSASLRDTLEAAFDEHTSL
jgi:hypothetical protein